MKTIFRKLYVIMKGFGYARAAAFHARQGDRKKAMQIMQEYDKCK
jgi:hypothetical protein